MRNRVLSILFALAVPAVALVPLVATGEPSTPAAQKKPGAASRPAQPAGEKSDKYDPDNITAISQYMETIAKGNERYAAKDFTAAIDAYKKAIALSPRNALGHYLLTETYLTQNNLGEAEASIKEAHENGDMKNPALRSRVLFLVADVYEREKKWEQAKTAWQAYAEHASKNGDAGFPQTGVERPKAIQKVLDQEKAYVAVRDRIAAEKAEKAADAGKATPPKK